MSTIPAKIRRRLAKEAQGWDSVSTQEKSEEVEELLDQAELFRTQRPPRQPVSLRVDPFDLSMIKRIAHRKGIPFTQLMAMWLHEKIEREKAQAGF